MEANDPCGIRLFGRVTASVSHEIRNVLAIMNENAGLLEDTCRLAEKGRPLDLQRMLRIAADLKQQVRRGDRITRGLSKLSHSVDAGGIALDANEWMATFVTLAGRMAFAQGVSLHAAECNSSGLIQSGFGLLRLMWACLDMAISAVGPQKRIELSFLENSETVCFRFGGLDALADLNHRGGGPEDEHIELGRSIQAVITVYPDDREIRLEVPNQGDC
jgi:hypothetical protein